MGKENKGIISGTTDCNELARNVPECFYKNSDCDVLNYLTEFEKKHFFAYEEETNCIKYNIDFKKLIDFIISEKKRTAENFLQCAKFILQCYLFDCARIDCRESFCDKP